MWYVHQDRQIIDRCKYIPTYAVNCILTKVQMQLEWIKNSLLKGAETTKISYAKKKRTDKNLAWYWKFTHNRSGTNIKLKIIQLLRENRRKSLVSYARFLVYYTISMSHSIFKNHTLDFIKIKNFSSVKYNAKRM